MEASGMTNGLTWPVHAPADAKVGGVGRHCPGWVPTTQVCGPNALSFCRAAIIAAAVCEPTEIPPCLDGPSGIAASAWSYCVCSLACCDGKSETRTWYAAV